MKAQVAINILRYSQNVAVYESETLDVQSAGGWPWSSNKKTHFRDYSSPLAEDKPYLAVIPSKKRKKESVASSMQARLRKIRLGVGEHQ